jgi:tellurite resistance protein TerC
MGSGEALVLGLFTAIMVVLVAVDARLAQRWGTPDLPHAVGITAVWVALAVSFGCALLVWRGPQAGMEFFTAYLLEQSLSVDNVFVFGQIFRSQGVPPALHHRVLSWGVLGALVTRGAFILAGAALLRHFHWVLYLFGGFLLWTGVRLLVDRAPTQSSGPGRLMLTIRRWLPVAEDYGDGRFLLYRNGRRWISPLLLVLLAIEATDVVFALDSVPAVFGVTRDVFVAYSSNILAVVGIRALYFVLAAATARLARLHDAVAVILLLVGGRMLAEPFFQVPEGVMLAAVAVVLTIAVVWSLLRPTVMAPDRS